MDRESTKWPTARLPIILAILTILLRLIPTKGGYFSSMNFSAMDAFALFAVTFCGWRVQTFLLVFATQLGGDLCLALLNDWEYVFHPTIASNYLSLALIAGLGYFLSLDLKYYRAVLFAFCSSVIFFLATNFHCWLTFPMYEKNWHGLTECYYAAIPFYRSTFAADMIFSVAFCAVALAVQKQSSPSVAREQQTF